MAQQRGLWPWLLQRISGAYLVFGMAVHVAILPLGKQTITFESVSARLQHGFWFVFDLLLLIACVFHGFNGLWSIFLDFNPSLNIRRIIAWGLVVFGLVWTAYGVFVLAPFTH